VAKAYPEEKVGVFAQRNGALEVVEYSELDPAEAAASDPSTGELRFGWSNICLHYFRRDWLEAVSDRLAQMGRYHIARKKIPSLDGPVAVRGPLRAQRARWAAAAGSAQHAGVASRRPMGRQPCARAVATLAQPTHARAWAHGLLLPLPPLAGHQAGALHL
jgi:hypothetical protein